MLTRILTTALLVAALGPLDAQTVVALDGYHNNESKMPGHYQWADTTLNGFSMLAGGFREHDIEVRTLRSKIDDESLRGIRLLIIVDPDTPAETDNPKYIEDSEIEALSKWVNDGGRLVLLGNDKGNADFTHLNKLAGRFGIQFLEETYPKVTGTGILTATGPDPIFAGGLNIYLVEVAPLKLSGPARSVLTDHGTDIMALASVGQGLVFALGDPWLYNEYFSHKDNLAIATNLFRTLLGD
ncbi:MAG: glucuronyl hydrolase [Gemmatimonadetes bacterium]|nr:glucuronyl hydrolase [Gemmatimonadota bacterium]